MSAGQRCSVLVGAQIFSVPLHVAALPRCRCVASLTWDVNQSLAGAIEGDRVI